jgi:DNA-binding NtrC family response regulator
VSDGPRILVVEDERPYRELLARQLGKRGYQVTPCGSAEEALEAKGEFDLALCDMSLPGMSGIELIGRLRERSPQTQAIVLTGQGSIQTAIEAMKLGAYHYLEKPVKLEELELYVRGACEKKQLTRENQDLRDGWARQNEPPRLVGTSPAIEHVRELVAKIGPTQAPVLIEGETGTGKDLVARALHAASPRKDRAFVAINCGALSESLLENELFGHVAGAFTGATKEQRGLFEVAHGGTLFIDEVGEMSLEIQKKFLRLLENGEFRRLGESRTRVADVRVIAATNRVLKEQVTAGAFREDLFYRLDVLAIRTPPLREHPADLPTLIEELIRRAQHGRKLRVSPQALAAFQRYDWPGNVRELRNVIERAVVLAPAEEIRLEDCPGVLAGSGSYTRPAQADPVAAATPSGAGPVTEPAGDTLEDVERAHVRRVLEECAGNKTEAAKRLGVSLRSLYRKIEKLDLK